MTNMLVALQEDSREFDTLAGTYDDYSSGCDTGI